MRRDSTSKSRFAATVAFAMLAVGFAPCVLAQSSALEFDAAAPAANDRRVPEPVAVESGEDPGGGDRNPGDDQQVLGPDLRVRSVDASALVGEWQELVVDGPVFATVENTGDEAAIGPFDVLFFFDRNGSGAFEEAEDVLLGLATASTLDPGADEAVQIELVGRDVLFRGEPIFASADPDDVVAESDETNNVSDTGDACVLEPDTSAFEPVLEWAWTSSQTFPDALNVIATPGVIDLDGDGVADVVFGATASRTGNLVEPGVLRALSGADGREIFTVTDASLAINAATSVAIGDIDGDGLPEIVAGDSSGTGLMAFENDGTLKWRADDLEEINWGGAAIGDLDGDGTPEIVVGRQALDAEGTLLWTGTAGKGPDFPGPLSVISDLDLDGEPEVVAGNTAYDARGNVRWQANVPDGRNAVANFDEDTNPEIVVVRNDAVWLLEDDGSIAWGPFPIPGGGNGGPPTVADFDGDGAPEIGVAGFERYAVIETDGRSLLWEATTEDLSSGVSGASVFDFEGDGVPEVVYRDETTLRVFAGPDGRVLWETPMSSCTWYEYVVVADVDADTNAEIVAVANDSCYDGPQRGVFVYGESEDRWVATRAIWNQHTYHITNVEDDGAIPAVERNHWLVPEEEPYNSFRQNVLTGELSPLATFDLTASEIVCTDSPRAVRVRVGNAGLATAPAGIPVSFYLGSPTEGGSFLGTVDTSVDLPSGAFEDVTLALDEGTPCGSSLFGSADDAGGLAGTERECREDNNLHGVEGFENRPPIADAGGPYEAECTLPATVVTLDGTGSSDPDGDPLSYTWTGSFLESPVESAVVDASFEGTGFFDVVLEVSDGELTDTDATTVDVFDTTAPTGGIGAPADGQCFGPEATPVVVEASFTDTCDSELDLTYDPAPGPAYDEHGDLVVSVTATDDVGNATTDTVSFTIDLVPPVVEILAPRYGWVLPKPGDPVSEIFRAGDDDGASGGVVLERILLQECVLFDGATYGDGDGLLSDELVGVTLDELCAVFDRCGFDVVDQPTVTVEAYDCGGNRGVATRSWPKKSVTVRPALCR